MMLATVNGWYTWAGLISSLVVIAGAVWAIVKHETRSILREVKPNGGQTDSNGDRTKRIEDILDKVDSKLDHVNSKLDQHIGHSEAVEEEIFDRLNVLESSTRPRRTS